MRLNAEQIDTIRRVVSDETAGVVIRLFGSRLDDRARGGDIDLLLEFDRPVDRPALIAARISAKLMRALHGRHVDVLLSAPNLKRLPIHSIAETDGVLL